MTRPRTLGPWIVGALLVAGTIAAYWNVGALGFTNYDDDKYVVRNPYVQRGLTGDGIAWAFRTYQLGNWHPLTWLSHMAVVQTADLDPAAHHWTNLLLHLASTLLLFRALQLATGALLRSGFVAALFALHPLHVESVAWISARKDVLSTVFWTLTMLAYVLYVRRPGKLRYAAVLAALALGFMSKAMLVTLPLVLLMMDVWPLRRVETTAWGKIKSESAERLLVEKLPMLAMSGAAAVLAILAQSRSGTVQSLESLSVGSRLANALVSCWIYVRQSFVPDGLAVFYPHGNPSAPAVAGAIAFAGVTTAAAIHWRKTRPYLAFGWLWYVVTLLPVIGLIQVGAQSHADRYTYVPLIGIFLVAGWLATDLLSGKPAGRAAVGLLAVVTLAACGALTRNQVEVWRDSRTLFRHAVAVTRDNYVAHQKLAQSLAEADRPEEAVAQYLKALEIKPDFAAAHDNLGVLLAQRGKLGDAIFHLSEAARLAPGNPVARNNLGLALARAGRIDEAVTEFETAVRLDPNNAEARRNLARARARSGRTP